MEISSLVIPCNLSLAGEMVEQLSNSLYNRSQLYPRSNHSSLGLYSTVSRMGAGTKQVGMAGGVETRSTAPRIQCWTNNIQGGAL
jgi:hypothetical protein